MPRTRRYWLHLNASTRDAHIILVDVPHPRAPSTVSTTVYRDVLDLADFLSFAIEVKLARATELLSDAGLAEKPDLWFELNQKAYDAMPERVAVMKLVGEPADGFIREGRKVMAYIGNGAFLDVTKPVPSATPEALAKA
jgi:hypothetical protein